MVLQMEFSWGITTSDNKKAELTNTGFVQSQRLLINLITRTLNSGFINKNIHLKITGIMELLNVFSPKTNYTMECFILLNNSENDSPYHITINNQSDSLNVNGDFPIKPPNLFILVMTSIQCIDRVLLCRLSIEGLKNNAIKAPPNAEEKIQI